jgi:hypothetical protein
MTSNSASPSGPSAESSISGPSISTSTSGPPAGPEATPSIGALVLSKTLNQSLSGLSSSLASIGKAISGASMINTKNGIFFLWLVYALIVFSTVSDLPYNQTKFTIYCCSIWFVLLAFLFLLS